VTQNLDVLGCNVQSGVPGPPLQRQPPVTAGQRVVCAVHCDDCCGQTVSSFLTLQVSKTFVALQVESRYVPKPVLAGLHESECTSLATVHIGIQGKPSSSMQWGNPKASHTAVDSTHTDFTYINCASLCKAYQAPPDTVLFASCGCRWCCWCRVLVTGNEHRIFDTAIAVTAVLLLTKLCMPRLYVERRATIVFCFHAFLTTLRA
jgi:hypothetical protein